MVNDEKEIFPHKDMNVKKISLYILFTYIFLVCSFYFLSGEQLYYRESRGNIEFVQANDIASEMYAGNSLEQIFVNKVQILEEVSVLYGNYKRVNKGTLTMELYNLSNNNELLLKKDYDISKVEDGDVLSMKFEKPVEGLYGSKLMIKIYSLNSQRGSSIVPFINNTENKENYKLYINGQNKNGILIFKTDGKDYIWIGLNYWRIVSILGLFVALYLFLVNYRYIKKQKSILLYFIVALQKYRFLMKQLISRDFRTKYKRSVLGVLWSFLNPLLTMTVQYFVFSNIFKTQIDNYIVYLLIGVVMFNFFNEAVSMTLTSIISNVSLITKVYVPKYIYPISRTLSSGVNLLISLVPLFFVILITGTRITTSYLLVIYPLIFITMFALGIGMILCALMVFFRDTQFLWGVISIMWMYATPIFYPIDILPKEYHFVIYCNPLYYFISIFRTCIIDGISPEPFLYIQSALIAIVTLLIGFFVFKKTQDKFVLYI